MNVESVPDQDAKGVAAAQSSVEKMQGKLIDMPDHFGGADSAVAAKLLETQVTKRNGEYFELQHDGVYFHEGGKSRGVVICGPLKLIGVSMDLQGEEPRAIFELVNVYGVKQKAEIPVTDWAGGVKVLREKCLRIDESPSRQPSKVADYMQAAFGTRASLVPRLTRVDRNGWLGEDCRHFCFNETIYSADGNDGGYLPERMSEEPDFVARGTLDEWKKYVAEPLGHSARYMMALSAGLAAPLVKMLHPSGMSPGLLFCASTSTGKSSILHAVNSLFGGVRLNNWNATNNSIEGPSHQFDCLPMPIDELGQSAQDLQQAIYMIANCVGKGRMKADATRRAVKTWSLVWFCSGEVSAVQRYKDLTGKHLMAGADIRLACIPSSGREGLDMFESLPPGYASLQDFMLTWDAERVRYTGTAGPAFLQNLLATIGKEGRDAIESGYATMRQVFDERIEKARAGEEPLNPPQARVLRCFALYAFAGELAIRYGVLPWAAGSVIDACAACFLAWMGREDSPESQLQDFLESLAAPQLERLTRWDAGAADPRGFVPSPHDKIGTGIDCQGQLCLVIYDTKSMSNLLKGTGITKKDLKRVGVKKCYLLTNVGETNKRYGMYQTQKERYGLASGWYWVVAIPAIKRLTDAAGKDTGDCLGPGPWSTAKAKCLREILQGKNPGPLV